MMEEPTRQEWEEMIRSLTRVTLGGGHHWTECGGAEYGNSSVEFKSIILDPCEHTKLRVHIGYNSKSAVYIRVSAAMNPEYAIEWIGYPTVASQHASNLTANLLHELLRVLVTPPPKVVVIHKSTESMRVMADKTKDSLIRAVKGFMPSKGSL